MLKKFKKHYQAEADNMAAAEGIIKEYKERSPLYLLIFGRQRALVNITSSYKTN